MLCSICGHDNDDNCSFCVNCGNPLAPGSRGQGANGASMIGPYEVIGEIGRGAMARVWRAWDTNLQREVAIKEPLFDPRLSDTVRAEMAQRFIIEARAAGRLSHPNIVAIHAADVYGDTPVIVMELVKGHTLSDLLAQGALSSEFALMLLDQLLDAVGYAHAHGVIHRDIKPDNIFVTGDNVLKLGDFGVARLEGAGVTTVTVVGTVLGTPGYMSPEQVLGHPVDGRSDLFSIGAVAYEMLTGSNPFGATDGASLATLLHRIAYEPTDPQAQEVLWRRAPEPMARAIMAALEKNPEQRPESADEFKAMLHGTTVSRSQPVSGTAAVSSQARSASGPTLTRPVHGYSTQPSQGAMAGRKASGWLPYAIVGGVCTIALCVALMSAFSGAGGYGSSSSAADDTTATEEATESEEAEVVEPEVFEVPSEATASMTFEGHTYALFDVNADWDDACDICEDYDGYLATVTSEGEQGVIEGLLASGSRNNYWIGGMLVAPQTWAWVTGESFVYTNWGEGAPDNWIVEGDDGNANGASSDDIEHSENALSMYRAQNPNAPHEPGTWNDLASNGDCNGESFFGLDNIGFICEWNEC